VPWSGRNGGSKTEIPVKLFFLYDRYSRIDGPQCWKHKRPTYLIAALANVAVSANAVRQCSFCDRLTEDATMKDGYQHSVIQRSMKSLLFCCALLVGIAFMVAPAAADSCSNLASLTLPETTFTTAQSITSGSFIPPGSSTTINNLPPFCRVAAFAAPTSDSHIEFEVWIPESNWNGKYLQLGCGGLCGSISYGSMPDPLERGYAVAATDDGHEASPIDASWTIGHPQKVVDFAYRALKVTTDDAKAIIGAYETPSGLTQSYFDGCSDGGREALMEAERYPQDFKGIIAGSPGNAVTQIATGWVWNWLAQTATPDSVLTQSDLTILSNAVLTQCAGHDGGLSTDLFLNNPPACNFNPESLLCTGNNTSNCLSQAKVTTIHEIYFGPPLIFPGFQVNEGTEAVVWPAWITGGGNPTIGLQEIFAQSIFSDAVFPNSGWTPTSATILQDIIAADETIGIVNSTDPAILPFEANGGKLIQYVGWSDPAISPQNDINYYTSVELLAGGPAATENFYRLFMVPGMGHCNGGPGANAFGNNFVDGPNPSDPSDDVLSALDQWVEQGIAPNQIIATKYLGDIPTNGVAFQRPLCPYPQIAVYGGTGATTQASNWVCEEPR
jgi:Tannase and feruloyl esterase